MADKELTPEEMFKTGRIKVLRVHRCHMPGLFRQGMDDQWFRCEGMPADAVIIGVSEHVFFLRDEYCFRVWSSEFPIVPAGDCCKEMEVVFYRSSPPVATQPGREFI